MTFNLGHGLVASLALHGALILPFVVVREEPPPEEPQLLMVELQGVVSDTQSDQQVLQQTKGAPEQEQQEDAREEMKTQTAQAAAPDLPKEEEAPGGTLAPAPPPAEEQKAQEAPPQPGETPAEARSGPPGLADVTGAREEKQAHKVAPELDEQQIIQAYARSLTKKMRDNLAYPPDAQRTIRRKGTTWVSFTVQEDGRLRPGSLTVKDSSGLAAYDAAALRTVEKNAPYDPPPRAMTIAVPVDYFPQ